MSNEELDALEALVLGASAAPWSVSRFDDELCMSAIAITSEGPLLDLDRSMRAGTWPTDQVVAATLIQAPAYVVPHDGRWHENAALIVGLRNSAPELIRLARIGLATLKTP